MNSRKSISDASSRLREADSLTATALDGAVSLRIPEHGTSLETFPPITVHELLARTARELPNRVALVQEVEGKWIQTTFKQYEEQVRICAKAFLKLGLERYHSVCILGFNSPEWFISDVAAIYAGGVAAGIYTTNSAEACLHCALTGKANIIVVQDDQQLQKIQSIKSQIPTLKKIIQYEGEPVDKDVLSWKQLMEIGRQETDAALKEVQYGIAVNECCTLVFTSGTVGNPKAVMLTHDNLTWDAVAISERLQLKKGDETVVSYLPLSHVAAQIVDIYIGMLVGMTIYFGDKNALKGTLLNTLQKAQPTRFLGVPRVWEKIHERMLKLGASGGRLQTCIAGWAKRHGLQHNMDKIEGKPSNTWSYSLARTLVFRTIRNKLGLGHCRTFASAAAPLSPEIKKYFLSIDIPIMDVFGMSEASGAHTITMPDKNRIGGIGEGIPGTKTKISSTGGEGEVNEDQINGTKNGTSQQYGEISLYGRHIFMGYTDEPEKTAEAIDSEGWLRSGDIGYIDDNVIYIVGRLKELLITAGGENIPPVPIEQAVMAELGLPVSNCVLIGDKRKFLTLLVTLKTEIDPETAKPTDKLSSDVTDWLKKLECPSATMTEVLAAGPNVRLIDELMRGVHVINAKATSNAQRIQKIAVLPADFSIATGELGPTMKLKRSNVTKKYKDIIEKLYQE